MRVPALVFLTVSLLGSFGWCKTKFNRPPDWSIDVRNRDNPEKNRRYVVGEAIQLDWESDFDDTRLYVAQQLHSEFTAFVLDRQ